MINDIPPAINGTMILTVQEISDIRPKLLQIQSVFEPTDEEPELTTHGLVSRYNFANPTILINGDTAEYLLSLSE